MRRLSVIFLIISASAVLPAPLAAQLGSTVSNWSIPANFEASASSGSSSTGTHHPRALGDIAHEIGFEAVTPCRIVDTRGPAGTFGGPALSPGSPRNFPLPTGPCAGIPSGVGAYSLNVTVTNTLGPGFIKIYPQGGAAPVVSTLNYVSGQTVANAAVVPAGTSGGIAVAAGVSGTDLIIDINGYFSASLNPTNFFQVVTAYSGGGGVILGQNMDTTTTGYGGNFVTESPVDGSAGIHALADAASGATAGVIGETQSTTASANGVLGRVMSTSPGGYSSGVRGINLSTTGLGIGVWGSQNGQGWGVFGSAVNGLGVFGYAFGSQGTGVYGTTDGTISGAGVIGLADSTVGTAPGVAGHTYSTSDNAFGVVGLVDSTSSGASSAGVRGINNGFGSVAIGVWGSDAGSGIGVLGEAVSGYGVQGSATSSVGGLAVFAAGNFVASGTKAFVEPHPQKAGVEIRYVALEGPEAGTYFRGRATFQRGVAVINVPEDFRLVTDAEGLSVQVTPIGAMATVAVLRIDLEKIVVQGSRDVDFFYTVNGVRKSEKGFRPVGKGRIFTPEGPQARMPGWLNSTQKQMLIANGTYNGDGTVNMNTARRLGWDKIWETRAEADKELANVNAAVSSDRSNK